MRNDLAKLCGARMVLAAEGDQNKRMSEAVIKQITGGDQISARFLYGEYFEYSPQFKLWLASNHKPKVIGQDYGFWRRVRLIPFSVTIPKEEEDHGLVAKLKAELPGILNWALAGLRAWQEQGLNDPEEVLMATGDYRTEEDLLQLFIDSECEVKPTASIMSSALYKEYKSWATDGGEYVMTTRDFSKRMQEKGYVKSRNTTGMWWKGICSRCPWVDEEGKAYRMAAELEKKVN